MPTLLHQVIARSKRTMRSLLLGGCGVLLGLFMLDGIQAAPADVGVVLLHGKWGAPQSLQPLARDLEAQGYLVVTPEMAWSGQRMYDIDYAAALQEIERHAKALRARGAKRVVVAGQSLGANAAVAYASSGLSADGLVLMSPGHFPEAGMGKRLRPSIDRARSLVNANQGSQLATFEDINQGQIRVVRTAARNYLSYFDPEGLGAMTRNIRKIPRPVPLLLVIGSDDPFLPESKAMFDSAPASPASRYLVLDGNHFSVPSTISGELLKWLAPLSK